MTSKPIILFDLDGTLVDNTRRIGKYIQISTEPYRNSVNLQDLMGKSLVQMRDILGIGAKEIEDIRNKYVALHNKFATELSLYPGIQDVLEWIKSENIPTAIVTSKLQETADVLISHLKLDQYFDVIITSQDVKIPKPDPEGLLMALKLLGNRNDQKSIYVGDSITDVITAQNAGMYAIGVTWGNSGTDLLQFNLEENFEYVNNSEELLDLLKNKLL